MLACYPLRLHIRCRGWRLWDAIRPAVAVAVGAVFDRAVKQKMPFVGSMHRSKWSSSRATALAPQSGTLQLDKIGAAVRTNN